MKTFRQGDWTFIEVDKDKKPKGKDIKLKENSFVFSEGETTGHFHKLHAPSMKDMELEELADGSFTVTLYADAIVTHPEHSQKTDLVIPAGDYLLFQRREKDWFSGATRRVVD